jgi:hypothetical protein
MMFIEGYQANLIKNLEKSELSLSIKAIEL